MENQLTLTVKPDYQGTGIFSDNNEIVSYANLSLPDEIKSAFESWINWYRDSFYHPEDFASDEFEARGLEISRMLKQSLKDSATVIYQGIKVKCDENNLHEEKEDEISYLLGKLNDIDKKMNEVNIQGSLFEEYLASRNNLCESIFYSIYKALPSLVRIGDFEIKDTGRISANEIIVQFWDDFVENTLDFVNNYCVLDFTADKSYIEEKIRNHCCDEQEIDLEEEELFKTYIPKVKEFLEEMEAGFENLWSEFSLNYSHLPEGRSMLITALHSDYVFNIEDLNYLYSLVDKYLPGYVSPTEKVKKTEEIAIQAHFYQPYGDHKENGDYYKYHLDIVRKIASGLAKKHSDLHTYKFEIAALLHDYLEDTHPTGQDIENLGQLFGEQMLQSIEKLTYRHDKGYDEYFKAISEDEIAKVVKTADRIANISALKEVTDRTRRKELFQKYILQFEFFEKYEILPDEIEETFEALLL